MERPTPKNKLSNEERETIVQTVNQPAFKSPPPSQIVPRLADEGVYIASESMFYRVLKDADMQHHRGRGPNQVWMWDISWLPGPAKGIYYYLYLIFDLYSRKIITWDVWLEESAENASLLVRRGMLSEQRRPSPQPLVLHSDNGSPTKELSLLETLYQLGFTPSRSRLKVSNDNPNAESIFRTCQYRPSYPAKGFSDLTDADFNYWRRIPVTTCPVILWTLCMGSNTNVPHPILTLKFAEYAITSPKTILSDLYCPPSHPSGTQR
ncbi:DDE-type integrase/transposase/recombinase [Paenibacillus lautus]|uniref:DDE-type integrase/transposase/recombinase n=1 Tax=Paenibacillus lautus TaxID=1401 RepID=UPI000FD8CE4E|nr:DDE-type integrase/transposase/recombinase [Paenibacillus lautus]